MYLKGYSDYKIVLIRSSEIRLVFDQANLAARQNPERQLQDKYHENWIHKGFFQLPSFWIEEGKAYVGIGRHRLTLLSKHMQEIPASFEGLRDSLPETESAYTKLVIREISVERELAFPDLPICDLGTDANGRPIWKDYVQ